MPAFLGASHRGVASAALTSEGTLDSSPADTGASSQIPLDVPPELRSKIGTEARVTVTVTVDEAGKISDAKATSIKGQSADLLIPEALKAARLFRFRPAREGEKAVRGQADLSFVLASDSRQP